MTLLSADDLLKQVGSRYSLVIAVAKRARQLREGAMKLVDSNSTNAVTIALQEIAAGKIKIIYPTPEEIAALAEGRRPAAPGVREAVELLRAPAEVEIKLEETAEAKEGAPVETEATAPEAVVEPGTEEMEQAKAEPEPAETAAPEASVEAEVPEVEEQEAEVEAPEAAAPKATAKRKAKEAKEPEPEVEVPEAAPKASAAKKAKVAVEPKPEVEVPEAAPKASAKKKAKATKAAAGESERSGEQQP